MTGLEWFLVILGILILAGGSRGIGGGGGGYQPRPLPKGAKLVPPQSGSAIWSGKRGD